MPGFGPHQASRRRRNSGGTPAPSPTPTLAALSLAVPTIVENTAAGSVIGPISGRTTGSTLSLFDDAGGRFALSGANLLAGLTATNFEAATSHMITIRETLAGATNNPRDTVLSVAVTNLFEAASLSALTLSSTAYTIGTPSSGTVTGAAAGSTIAASGLPTGLTVNGAARTWAWDGTGAAGSTAITLTETLADSANSPRASSVGVSVAAGIGGVAIGSAGSGIYSGHTLSDGDEFNSLDLVSAANPSGAYFTQRMYSSTGGMRAPATGALAVMHDVSPDYTGWQDQARGAAQNYDSHTVSGSVLTLKAIRQTAGEQTNLATGVAGQIERGSMLHTAGRLWYNSPAIIEWRARMPTGPAGQHPTLWGLSVQGPGGDMIGNEYGYEGNGAVQVAYNISHAAGSATTVNLLNTAVPGSTYRDGNFHTYTVILTATQYIYYVDGTLLSTLSIDPDTAGSNKADYAIITNHPYSATWGGQAYDAAAWAADLDGVNIDLDWIRVWRPTAGTHYAPLTGIADTSIVHGATTTIVLPSQATLWGASGLTEFVCALQNEVEEPGGSNSASYDQFPTGVTYDSGTRTISVAGTLTGSGVLHFAIGVSGDGFTCKPARFRLYVAPRWVGAASYSWTDGVAITAVDVYTSWDAGRLFQSGANRKGLTVTGLPTGLSFSSSTGLITGTPSGGASGNLTIGCTNSAGQTTSRTQGFAVAAGDVTAPTLSLPTDAANGSTGGTLTVTTNEANGTLYWFVSASGTPPTAANLKTGTGAVSSGNQAVSATGVQNSSATGLIASTAYFAHFLHRDAAGNDSAIVSGDGFTTTAGGAAAYTSWTGPGWFDASDAATLTLSGSAVTALANKRSGGGNLTVGGTGANITRISAAQNGRDVIRVVRDVSTGTSPPRLVATAGSPVSQRFQGNDQPYLVIAVYKPTDTNTAFIFSASASLSASLNETVSLVRRNATASASRKSGSGDSGEVVFGSGQAAGAWRIVAIKHSGTAVSIWDTSTTKSVNAAADDKAAITTGAQFMLFANVNPGGGYAPNQCNKDFAEIIVEATQSDADVQQAITDLGTKWGITLS